MMLARWEDRKIGRWQVREMARWLCLVVALAASSSASADMGWRKLSDGIEYRKLSIEQVDADERKLPPGFVHLFQVNPSRYRVDTLTAKEFGLLNIDARTMAKKSGAVLAINGGFFSPEFTTLGLLVQNGRELNKLKPISWWHVFQLKGSTPQVVAKQEYALSKDVVMAIEAGPRLVINGEITPNLKPSTAERTAIGTTMDDQVIIAVTENYRATMSDLARIIKDNGGMNVLNLDGGSSTQAYAKIKGFELDRPGFGSVANGIVVVPR